jgi:hypothetical protein
MLALWEYFWTEADWVPSSDIATAVTLTGPSFGFIDQASSSFTVGVDGSLTSVVTVIVTNTGGTGVFSQSTFSLSTGAATGTFTYTPSTLGTHVISETNNAALSDAPSLSYVVSTVPIVSTSGGGGGSTKRKSTFYYHTDDEFWKVRENYLKYLKSIYTPSVSTTYSPSTNELTLEVPSPINAPTPPNAFISPTYSPITVNPQSLPRYIAEAESLSKLAEVSTSISELQTLASRLNSIHTAINESRRIIVYAPTQKTRRQKKISKLSKLLSIALTLKSVIK